MTTVGTLKNYRYGLNRSNNTMAQSMNTVLTRRNFNSYAEDPALATRCFQIRHSYQRTEAQLTVNDSLRHKYDVAWESLSSCSTDLYAIASDTVFGQLLRAESQPTASGISALGQSMAAKAKNLVQNMNGRYGEHYVFSGADTLNVPFTWEARKNSAYIDPAIAVEKANDPNLTDAEKKEYIAACQFVKDDGAGGKIYTNTAEPGVTADNPAYNEETSFQYLTSEGEGTHDKFGAGTALCYRGVPVDSNDPKDQEKLNYFMSGESKYIDVGLGHKEENGEAVGSTVFDCALQGIYYLGGTGTEEMTVTVGEGAAARTVTKEVPNNIISVVARMGQILQRCSSEDGRFASSADEDEFAVLAHKFEDQKDTFIQRWTEMDTQTGFLRDNSEQLEDTAYSLKQQYLELEEADPAAAISEYMFARYAYDAALKVGNSVLSQSLMDYLNL